MVNKCTIKPKVRLRRGPRLELWIWCLIIKCLISLPCLYCACQGQNISISILPEGFVLVPYGEPLEMFCVAEQGTADNLSFVTYDKATAKIIPSEQVNDTTRRLYIEKIDKGVYSYHCDNKATGKLCVSRVLVGSPPSNVTDFECVSKNLEELTCTWTSPENYMYTNDSLTFAIYENPVPACIARKIGEIRSCSWTTTSKPRYKQMEDHYYFHLTSCNYFGCNNQDFTIDHYSIVKPDAPNNLKVIKCDSHGVLLHWTIPNNMLDFLPHGVVHRIEYQIAERDNTAHFRSVDASRLPGHNKTYQFWLSNLPYAHMQYEVRIYIKSAQATEEKFWSDFTYLLFYTLSERPQRPPDTIEGAFYQSLYDDKRVIYVYWKQLEAYEEAGANFTYKVVVSRGSMNPQTLHPDKNKSLSYIFLNEATLEAMDIAIWSTNANGTSVNSSHLYIPAQQDTEELKVESFTKNAHENGTYVLSWVGIENIDNYTLFWCHHDVTGICAGRMDFVVLDPNKNSHVVHLPTASKYQFAISANKGSRTSGMKWTICDISKDLIPTYRFPVKLHHDTPGKSSVKLTWTMSCTLQQGIISGYQLSYCPVSGTSDLCDSTWNRFIHYISDPKVMEVKITDLMPYQTYLFTLALNTTYGLRAIENAAISVTTVEDTPTSPINVSISEVESDSLVISWDPPLRKNGIIGKYVVLNFGKEIYVESVPVEDSNARMNVKLTGLYGYTSYSLSVQACNTEIRSCSKPAPRDGLLVRTKP